MFFSQSRIHGAVLASVLLFAALPAAAQVVGPASGDLDDPSGGNRSLGACLWLQASGELDATVACGDAPAIEAADAPAPQPNGGCGNAADATATFTLGDDNDGDGIGDDCDADDDNDGVPDGSDACPNGSNVGADTDGDGCRDDGEDFDDDADGCDDAVDRAPRIPSGDSDADGVPDDCDNCPADDNPGQGDDDNDGVGDACDNCPEDANPQQADANSDDEGDACEDGPYFSTETLVFLSNPFQQVHPHNVYGIAHAGGSVVAFATAFLPFWVGLDGADVQGDLLYFTVKPAGFLTNPDGSLLQLQQDRIFVLDRTTGFVTEHLDLSDLGLNVATLGGFDLLDDGSVVFTVDANQLLFFQNRFRILRPSIAYRLTTTFPRRLFTYFDGGAVGLGSLDAIEVLRDGRLAFSTADDVFISTVNGLLHVRDHKMYVWDPDTDAIELYFDGNDHELTSIDAFSDGDVPEFPATPLGLAVSALGVSCGDASDGSATVAPSGGTPPYEIQWDTGDTTATVNGLPAGSYDVVVTDATGQTATATAVVADVSAVSVSVTTTETGCHFAPDGTATATPSGGVPPYMFLWSDGQTTQTATGLAAGTYVVTVKDANGCPASATAVVEATTACADIDIEKATNGLDADDPNAGDAPQIQPGNLVSWTYVVTNTGSVTLSDVTVIDDQGVPVACPQDTLNPGHSMICTASGLAENLNSTGFTTVPGLCGGFPGLPLYENMGQATGQSVDGGFVQDVDPSHYCNPPTPDIDIEKATDGVDADDPNAGDAPQIAPGSLVTWTYVVTNTGSVTLDSVTVTDDQGVAVSCPQSTLAPNQSMTCTASGLAEDLSTTGFTTVPGLCGGFPNAPLYENRGQATAQSADGGFVQDVDPSHYCNPPCAGSGESCDTLDCCPGLECGFGGTAFGSGNFCQEPQD